MPMQKNYLVKLNSQDVGLLINGLETRAVDWEKMSRSNRLGRKRAGEAASRAAHYRYIIHKIITQIGEQS